VSIIWIEKDPANYATRVLVADPIIAIVMYTITIVALKINVIVIHFSRDIDTPAGITSVPGIDEIGNST